MRIKKTQKSLKEKFYHSPSPTRRIMCLVIYTYNNYRKSRKSSTEISACSRIDFNVFGAIIFCE